MLFYSRHYSTNPHSNIQATDTVTRIVHSLKHGLRTYQKKKKKERTRIKTFYRFRCNILFLYNILKDIIFPLSLLLTQLLQFSISLSHLSLSLPLSVLSQSFTLSSTRYSTYLKIAFRHEQR